MHGANDWRRHCKKQSKHGMITRFFYSPAGRHSGCVWTNPINGEPPPAPRGTVAHARVAS